MKGSGHRDVTADPPGREKFVGRHALLYEALVVPRFRSIPVQLAPSALATSVINCSGLLVSPNAPRCLASATNFSFARAV
jgi:hypothetical protein